MNRLENLSAELAEQLRQASPDRQRAAGLAACNYAITHVPVGHPVLNQALQILNQGGSISPAMLRQLELLAANLDEEYFDLQAATDRGEATSDACTQKFAQARAVSAVGAAFDEDPFEASSNAIYEAAFVADDTAPLFQVIKATLS